MLLGRWRGALVAVKVLKQTSLQRSNTAALIEFQQEADMLQRLRHPNILNFYGACFDCQPVCASSANTVRMSLQCNCRCVRSARVELSYVRVGSAVLAQHHLQHPYFLQHACSPVSVEAQVFH